MIVVLIGKTLKGVSVTIPKSEDDRASDEVGSARPRV